MDQKKPILVTQSSIPDLDEYVDEIKPIFQSKWLTNKGEKHEALESSLKRFLGVNNLTLFVNGHLALYLAIKSFDFAPGSEVITTPFSFASTTHAIVQNGLKPVFCDIEPGNCTIDTNKIEELITDKTVAIVPVHVYGYICDVEKIQEIAERHNLKVIYDAAHVFGVEYNGSSIANWGDMSMFSFHATKVFNTIEGGALAYKDKNFEQRLNYLKNFGIEDAENVKDIGINAKMNEFAAAMGICNLRHFEEEIKKREHVFNRYMERLFGVPGLYIPSLQDGVKPNYAYFPVFFDKQVFGQDRDEIYAKLEMKNIYARKYFYPLISDYDCYRNWYDSTLTPIAKKMSDSVLTLPMYADLSLEVVDEICDIILGQ